MLLSLSRFLFCCAVMSYSFAEASTRVYNFTAEWVRANPDGLFERPVIGINGQWPIPRIEATVGDRLIVNLNNNLGNQSTSIHFHGLFMNSTSHMDGVVGTTQCGVPPGGTFTYNFTVDQPGSYWYHSHLDGQYPDGFRGPLIVEDPQSPYNGQYDGEIVITLSDWYHDEMPGLIQKFLSVANPTGAEPVPNSALMNDTQNLEIPVEPDKTYLIRFINMAAFAAQHVWIEGHSFRIVEVDGVWTEEAEANLIYIAAAQRYSVLVTTRNDTSTNFAINGAMDQDLFDKFPEGLDPNVTSFLVYDPSAPMPSPSFLDQYDDFDDHALVPYDRQPLLEDPDYSFKLDVKMDNLGDGVNYAFMNDITYVRQKVPSIFTALTAGSHASNPAVYGVNSNTFILEHNQVIEVIVNNHDPGKHPFHLHGHNFQCLVSGQENTNDYNPANSTIPDIPMKRDTWVVRPNGHIVIRFRADNPGVWLYHCHIEWHVNSGLTATFVEAPFELQSNLSIPPDHYAACNADNAYPKFQTQGNAAGRTTDLLNLEGAYVSPAPLPEGFTARGIVALIFSVMAALLGLAAVTWYGLGELAQTEQPGSEEVEQVDGVKRENH